METSSQQTTLEVCQSPSFSKDLLIINQVVGMHIDMYFEEIPTSPPLSTFHPPPPKNIYIYIIPSSGSLKIWFLNSWNFVLLLE